MRETRSTCPYCGVGCGVIIESDGTRITGVRGDPEHPANHGRLCTKGQTLHLTAAEPVTRRARLLQPMRRVERGGELRALSWGAALDEAAARIAGTVQTHGPGAVGVYVSGQLLTEDYHVFNKLARAAIGTPHIDTNSRLCMSSAVAGYKATLGADAPPACYDDLALADTVFIAGSNTAWAHPVLFRRLEDARRARPHMKLVVVDPRRTETAESADLHLMLAPGSDVALFHGMLHVLLWEGLAEAAWIAAHTAGFDALRERVREFTPKETARLTGLAEADIVQAARWFGQHDRPGGATLSLYCQGLNQSTSGTAKNAALVNLHLATAQIGRPGTGPFSLTGQPNAMGGREAGGLANLLPGHRDAANPAHWAEVERLWGLDRHGRRLPGVPGKTAVEMFQAAADGEIRLLWIACTNPAQSLPDQATVRRALQRADFVIVQEAFAHTATTDFADLLLPATTWGEKDGTVTNSERRISRVRAAVPAPGEARDDWRIAADVARRVETLLHPGTPSTFDFGGPEAVWSEHREATRGRDLDITGMSYALLDALGPQHWPMPEGASAGRPRLYEDARFATADGRARFADVAYAPVAEPRDARYPFALTTGRLRDQWHGMSRSGTLGRLFGHVAEPSIELHPHDLQRLGLAEGDLVHVTSRRGSVLLPARTSAQLAPMQAFIAMHWGSEFVSGSSSVGESLSGVNQLTVPAFCPASKQPELKHAAVKVLKAELPWRLLGLGWHDDPIALRERLRPLMRRFPFACCVPFGRERDGVLFRAAAHEPAPDELIAQIESAFALDGASADLLRYADRKRGQRRSLRLRRDGTRSTVEALLLAGDTRAESWLAPLLKESRAAEAYGRFLLMPSATPPPGVVARGRQVCNCFDVAEPEIASALAAGHGPAEQRLAQVQATLKCGTQCGSCLPELRRLARLHALAA